MAIFFPGGHVAVLSITILLVSLSSLLSFSSSSLLPHQRRLLQTNSPQNIETFFPSFSFPAFPSQTPPPSSSPPPLGPPPSPYFSLTPSTTTPPTPPPPKTKSSTVAKAIVATAASTLVVAGVFFFFLQKCALARRRQHKIEKTQGISSPRRDEETAVSYNALKLMNGTLKGLVVDENGLDVLYWRQLEGGDDGRRGYKKEVLDRPRREKRASRADAMDRPRREKRDDRGRAVAHSNSDPIPRIPSNSSATSSSELQLPNRLRSLPRRAVAAVGAEAPSQVSPLSPPKTENPTPLAKEASEPLPPLPEKKNPAPPPPPPPPSPEKKNPASSQPQPPLPEKKNPAPPPPPPPPPLPKKKKPAPPLLPPRPGSLRPSSSKGRPGSGSGSKKVAEGASVGERSSKEKGEGQTKLKPLHWDKVTANAEHSMVWDKIANGSFHFDDNLMEALFGYVATNRKSPSKPSNSTPTTSSPSPPAQTCLLDPRKSQNIAIVLRSLAISRQDILDTLLNGQPLTDTETLEKLAKIAPTNDEQAQILAFSGNPTNLADAESFLYHLLKAVPFPFLRLDAILFRSTYEAEILQLKHSIQALESACKELRTRGLFLKLLEAVLKAGNRMNAGTARGNAQAFNLSALRKLSDVKSTDGKTTLLHFVVEEVVRSEGKRCVLNRNHSLRSSPSNPSNPSSKEEREREYMMLGLPVVGGLSAEFSNVKKAAGIDFDGFIAAGSSLASRVSSIRKFLASQPANVEGGGFVREMKAFLEAADEELKLVKGEEERVVELVRRTTEYYQTGASKEKGAHPLQLFVIVNDFLSMVDRVCVDIARNQQQQKKKAAAAAGSSSPPQASSSSRPPSRFPNLPAHFLSKTSSSSDSEDGF